jgi:hypothetical protein
MNSEFLEAANSLVWSVWGEIGVPSSQRRSIGLAIDLEPLIHLTAVVDGDDPRLRSHADAWRGAFSDLVSRARLKRLGGDISEPQARPAGREAMSGEATLDTAGPAAVQLRIRSALGVSARAEIIRQLILDPQRTRRSSAELARLCGYTKRNTEKALESLERGGWIVRIRGGASLRWSLADRAALGNLFSPLPPSNASFMALAEIVEMLTSLDGVATRETVVRSAATRQLLADLQPTADWGEIELPKVPSGVDAWRATLEWTVGLPQTAL